MRYPLLAVGVSLLAAQQFSLHTASQASAPSPTPSPSPTSSPTPPLPSFDLTVLPYYSKAAFLSQSTVRLFQYQTCPFCNKVRAYLDYARVPYELVEVNPMSKVELRPFNLKAVPVVTVDHLVLHESTSIITAFDDLFRHYDLRAAAAHHSGPRGQSPAVALPPAAADPEEARWREWVDTRLLYLTAPNLYTSLSASLRAMDYIMAQTSLPLTQRLWSKYVGGPAMYLVSEFKLKKKRGIKDARGELFAACREWAEAGVGQGRPFRGGREPDLSDLAVFGVVRAMMGFPAGDELMSDANVGPGFTAWYHRMEAEVGPSSAKNASGATVGADYRRSAPLSTQ